MKNKLIILSFIFFWVFTSVLTADVYSQEETDTEEETEESGESDAEEETEAEESETEGAEEEAEAPAETPAEETPEETEAAAEPEETPAPEPALSTVDFSIEKILKSLNSLKKKLKQSEKRMNDIVTIVLSSVETKGSRIALIYRSEMSPDFKLVQATFSLDGAPIYKKHDDDGITTTQELEIYDGAILPGKHKLSATLVFRGHGYGILSYLSKYKFKVRSSHSFEVKQAKGVKLKVVSFEKGDINTKIEDRPAIKYIEKKISME